MLHLISVYYFLRWEKLKHVSERGTWLLVSSVTPQFVHQHYCIAAYAVSCLHIKTAFLGLVIVILKTVGRETV